MDEVIGTAIDKNRNTKNIVYIILSAISFLFLIIRVHYGIDMSDESWYISDIYTIAKGDAVPYVTNWSQASGYTFPLSFIYIPYVKIFGSEGIVLFSRLIYVFWVFGLSTITYIIVRKNYYKDVPIMMIPLLSLISINNLFDINYNTIGAHYLPIIILFGLKPNVDSKSADLKTGIICGILAGRMVIGTPATVGPVLLLCLVFLIHKKGTRLVGYIVGGATSFIIVMGYCAIAGGGIGKLISGIMGTFGEGSYMSMQKRTPLSTELYRLFMMGYPCIIIFVLILILHLVSKRVKRDFLKYQMMILIISLAFGIICGFRNMEKFASWTWFQPALLYLNSRMRKEKDVSHVYIDITVLIMAFYFVSSLTNIFGFSGRFYILYTLSIISVCSINQYLRKTFSNISNIVEIVVVTIFLSVFLFVNYYFVYGDDSVQNLEAKMESGPWKGCYTSEDNKELVELVDLALNECTDDSDKVAIISDWSCYGYMLINGKICAPSTLNVTKEYFYNYYKTTGVLPNKVIYIEGGSVTPWFDIKPEDFGVSQGDIIYNKTICKDYIITTYEVNKEQEEITVRMD